MNQNNDRHRRPHNAGKNRGRYKPKPVRFNRHGLPIEEVDPRFAKKSPVHTEDDKETEALRNKSLGQDKNENSKSEKRRKEYIRNNRY